MRYSNTMLESGRQQIDEQSQQAEAGASWNYYSQFGGTGMESPALKMAMYGLGKSKRKASDNLGAYYSVLSKQEDMQDKWQKIWEEQQRKEQEDANKFDWGKLLGPALSVGSLFI